MDEHIARTEGPNIGRRGENLTIMFLSYNRINLSQRLCLSAATMMPDFAGEVLVVDNGSSEDELLQLVEFLKGQPFKSRVVRLGQNYGVAGGRNRGIAHVETEWVLSLDNDIYFVSDPRAQMQSDLAQLGCKFASLPLLKPNRQQIDTLGGHIFVSPLGSGDVAIGGSAATDKDDTGLAPRDAFFGTFLFGGASVFEREAFLKMGGFDEGYFVGFEDTDLSIRLFRAGMKVGCLGFKALVHDHPQAENDIDRNYEKVRYSRDKIKQAALHLEDKYGFSAWNDGLIRWLNSKSGDTGAPEKAAMPAAPKGKIRAACVVDVDYWAFANIGAKLQEYLIEEFSTEIIPSTYFETHSKILLGLYGFDIVHFMSREVLSNIIHNTNGDGSIAGHRVGDLLNRVRQTAAFTSHVYDHLNLQDKEFEYHRPMFKFVEAYAVSSNLLKDIYSQIPGIPAPAAVLPDGVDLNFFKPPPHRIFGTGELRVGWVGNSKWAHERGSDFKGLRTVLEPAIAELQAEGIPVRLVTADRSVKITPMAQMPDYYGSIDVLVCASAMEGTPNPVLEAMACGVPIVTTAVGIVSEALGAQQSEFILGDRSIKSMKAALRRLHSNRELLPLLSGENLTSIQAWDWRAKARDFGPFFRTAIERWRDGTTMRAGGA